MSRAWIAAPLTLALAACAPPEDAPGAVILGPDAVERGVVLELGDVLVDSSLPVQVFGDEEAWVVGPDGQDHRFTPDPDELLQIYLDGEELLAETGTFGLDLDPDAALVQGDQAQALAAELGIQGSPDDDGLWLRTPGLWELLTDPALPEVEALFPLELAQTPQGLLAERASVSSPSPRALEVGAQIQLETLRTTGSGAASTASSSHSLTLSGDTLSIRSGSLGVDPLLVGFYQDGEGHRYELAADGSLRLIWSDGTSLRGFFVEDEAGQVHFYAGAEGPVMTLRRSVAGSLESPEHTLRRLEDLMNLEIR